jgi:hypothetical protein
MMVTTRTMQRDSYSLTSELCVWKTQLNSKKDK